MQPMPPIGCNTFMLPAADNSVIVGRAMDYPIDMQSQINAVNRGTAYTTKAPDGSSGLGWTSIYGYLGINAFNLPCYDEGMNEKGLSFAILTLKGTEYPKIEKGEEGLALPVIYLGAWVLSNFATCEEVKEAIKTVKVWGDTITQINQAPLVHMAVHDSMKNCLVVEFIKGKTKVYDNPIGVLTNEPRFEFHLHDLEFYNQLTSSPAANTTVNGQTIVSYPETGLDGMPGGYSSKARFVRLVTLIRLMTKPQTAIDAVIAASRVLNSVDLLPGLANYTFNGQPCTISTQWGTMKDLSHKIFYWRISDGALNSINLAQVNFAAGTSHPSIPLSTGQPTIINKTI